MGEGAQ